MIKGKELTLRWLKQQSQAIQNEVRDSVEDAVNNIYLEAREKAPKPGNVKTTYGTQVSQTDIAQFIFQDMKPAKFQGSVYVETKASLMAAYFEFGTGNDSANYVPTLPPEWQEVARRYYVNGKGTLLKQPFLLPAYFRERKEFMEALKKIVENNRS